MDETMRLGLIPFLLLCVLTTSTSVAQPDDRNSNDTVASNRRNPAGVEYRGGSDRLLSPNEGLSVIGAALESRRHARSQPDCSHLVHAIYERAGFSYTYAKSSDLYAGIGEFQRVTRPQPGDLVVWAGHAGIVVNPAQRSFFSALQSGLGMDSYDAPYWKERGRYRFFRYIKEPASIHTATIRRVSTRRTAAGTEPREPISASAESDAWEKAVTETGPAETRPEAGPMNRVIPRSQVINAVRPQADQVREVLLQRFRDTAEALREEDIFSLAQPVIILDRFEVKQVHVKHDQGWAEVRISGLSSAKGGGPSFRKFSEQQRWVLNRQGRDTWEIVPPDSVYLPRDSAVQILAHQLAALTEQAPEAGGSTKERAELARVLYTLLQQ